MKKDLDAILGSSQRLFAAQNAAAALTSGSDKLLSDSRDLFQAFTAFGSLRDKSLLGNLWIRLVFGVLRSEEHTSELQSLIRTSYAVFCLKKKTLINHTKHNIHTTYTTH